MSSRRNPPHRRAADFLLDKTPDQYGGPCAECLILRLRELVGFLLSEGLSRPDAIDAAQNTIVTALETLNTRGADFFFKNHIAWLWEVLKNNAHAIRRKRLVCDTDAMAHLPAPPSDEADRCDQARFVRNAVDTLHVSLRQVLKLHYIEELTYVEVASVLGITTAVVKHRLAHARSELRDILLSRGFKVE